MIVLKIYGWPMNYAGFSNNMNGIRCGWNGGGMYYVMGRGYGDVC